MADDVVILQFSTSTEWASMLIRRLCHSPFSHVDLLHNGGLLGASDPGGVKIRPYDYQPFGIRRQAVIRTPVAQTVRNLLESQLGKPFDRGAVKLRTFFSDKIDRDWRQPNEWFCSELIVWALETAGFFPYPLIIPKNRVTPADLLLLLNGWIDGTTFWQPVVGLNLGLHEV